MTVHMPGIVVMAMLMTTLTILLLMTVGRPTITLIMMMLMIVKITTVHMPGIIIMIIMLMTTPTTPPLLTVGRPAELQFYTSVASVGVVVPSAFLMMDMDRVRSTLDLTMAVMLLANGIFFHFQTISAYVLMDYISPVTHRSGRKGEKEGGGGGGGGGGGEGAGWW